MLGLTHDFDQCKEFAGRDSLPGNCSAIEARQGTKKMNINYYMPLLTTVSREIKFNYDLCGFVSEPL
jgi:hypothetical protein